MFITRKEFNKFKEQLDELKRVETVGEVYMTKHFYIRSGIYMSWETFTNREIQDTTHDSIKIRNVWYKKSDCIMYANYKAWDKDKEKIEARYKEK